MARENAIEHKLTTRCVGVTSANIVYRSLIKHAVLVTLKAEQVDLPCTVNVLITNDEGIREYNKEHRNIDQATDVLSFPMQDFEKEGWKGITKPDLDLDTQTLPLGDIVISLTTIKRHARRYGFTVEMETTRMMIHSTLHLLGYDHGETMSRKEEALMIDLGYSF